jgi:hypothetical protein
VYADWLEERGDHRAEFLRLQLELAELPEEDKSQREKLQRRLGVLGTEADADWRAVVDQAPVEACFARRAEHREKGPIRFDYKCPMRWDDLRPGKEDLATRFCDSCKKRVFHCSTLEQAQRHADRGHCIAVDSALTRRQGDVRIDPTRDPASRALVLGMPTPPLPRFQIGQRVRLLGGERVGAAGRIVSLALSQLSARVRKDDGEVVEVEFEEMMHI